MRRVTFFGFPARGHTVPSLPLVAELRRRGVQVDYHSTPPFQALIEASGARFRRYPEVCDTLARPRDLDEHLLRGLEVTAQVLPELLAGLEPCELVLFDASALWGGLIARRRALPSVVSITTFAFSRSLLQLLGAAKNPPTGWEASEPLRRRLNAEFGADVQDHLGLLLPDADLKLVYTSRFFQPAGKHFDDSHLFLGPLLEQRAREGEAAEPAGTEPFAYLSLGTIFNRDRALLLRLSEALSARGWRVLVALGDAGAQAAEDWPPRVRVHPFVDQIGVLSRAQLFVTHGGMNSVSEALGQGVPMLVIPQGVDQHLVARRTAALGAGLVLERDALSTGSLDAALERLERERAAFAAAAARVQHSFTEVTPLQGAVQRILALLDGEGR